MIKFHYANTCMKNVNICMKSGNMTAIEFKNLVTSQYINS